MACLSRRTLARLAGFLVLVALAPVLATLAWPHYRPPLRDGETYGLDVSSHQGTIDWPAVSRDGISAAYVKASEGGTWRDSHFATNWQGARRGAARRGVPLRHALPRRRRAGGELPRHAAERRRPEG